MQASPSTFPVPLYFILPLFFVAVWVLALQPLPQRPRPLRRDPFSRWLLFHRLFPLLDPLQRHCPSHLRRRRPLSLCFLSLSPRPPAPPHSLERNQLLQHPVVLPQLRRPHPRQRRANPPPHPPAHGRSPRPARRPSALCLAAFRPPLAASATIDKSACPAGTRAKSGKVYPEPPPQS
jgi:hypothetical protein